MTVSPIKYARKVGVNVGERCNFVSPPPNWGSEPWLITIGNHVELSGNVTFITHDGATWVIRDQYKDVLRYGKIIIHDNCFIGSGTTIMLGVEIGENSIIGANSVVTKSIPKNSVYAGNPARFISSLEDYRKKCIEGTPNYDVSAYKRDKKHVVLKLLDKKMKF